MLYGIEQSTDMRCPRTVVKKFTSRKALAYWLMGGGGYTYADPDSARNWHHSFRSGFELSGRIDKSNKIFKDSGTPTYPRNATDNLATYIQTFGKSIMMEAENEDV